MGLALKLQEGEVFYIDDLRWQVVKVPPEGAPGVVVRGPKGQEVTLTDEETKELEPQVRVSQGLWDKHFGRCRLVFEAPPKIRIMREQNYVARTK
jgi:hypothetical protein